MKVRVITTGSKAKAVQVVNYFKYKTIVLKHIGSAHDSKELGELKLLAYEWIKNYVGELSLFPDENPNNLLLINHSSFLGIKYRLFYDTVYRLIDILGLAELPSLLNDLVIIRIFEPASKLRSLDLLEQFFGVKHNRKTYYKIAPKCIELKNDVEKKIIRFVESEYDFNYDLLFYDVTTLYFETFEEDELRKNGFSKDNKSQQPQILVALMVSKEGFPVSYEVFAGNTFEGHTIIPTITKFIEKNKVKTFTVVADAAMISTENIEQLIQNKISYIVGARLGNVSSALLDQIDRSIIREDRKSIRIKTDNGYLICSYSSIRYRKDKYEMEKQIEKAKLVVEKPSKGKKLKFTQLKDTKISLNEALIDKNRKLLGIKGYYTNLQENEANNEMIIDRYHELYRIEQAYRISKNDLQTRPIFHFKEEPIKLHMLICFIALVISKHIELKTGISIKKFIDESKKNVDGEIHNQVTDRILTINAKTTSKMNELILKLFLPH